MEIGYGEIFTLFFITLGPLKLLAPFAQQTRGLDPPALRAICLRIFVISLIVNTGMWLERFVIVVISLSRDYIPSIWNMYYPTKWDWMTYIGTFGLFFTLFLLFVRFLPMISIVEMRSLVRQTDEKPE